MRSLTDINFANEARQLRIIGGVTACKPKQLAERNMSGSDDPLPMAIWPFEIDILRGGAF